MTSTTCSSDSCRATGGFSCAGCKTTSYCSKECQKAHWKTHKLACPSARKYNCFLIHAPPNGVVGDVSAHIEPFHLRAYGREKAEVQELTDRLGWSHPSEAGKFYDHCGSDEWYYWAYADLQAEVAGKPRNVLSKGLCYEEIHGDLAVIRSGPIDMTIPELFSSTALAGTVKFYENHSRKEIFMSREKSRMGKRIGVDMSSVRTVDAETLVRTVDAETLVTSMRK